MSSTAEERWRQAVQTQLNLTAAALTLVDATCPRTRWPWWRRAWWRVVGTPADVRVRMARESKRRAELFVAELAEHRGEAHPS